MPRNGHVRLLGVEQVKQCRQARFGKAQPLCMRPCLAICCSISISGTPLHIIDHLRSLHQVPRRHVSGSHRSQYSGNIAHSKFSSKQLR